MTRKAKCVYWIAVILTFLLVIAIMCLASTKAHAATLTTGEISGTKTVVAQSTKTKATNPYPDVTIKTVGKTAWQSIKFVKSKKGYRGIVGGTSYKKVIVNGKTYYQKVTPKFKPWKKVTRAEFLHTLGNLYGGKKIPVNYNDIKNANKIVTGKYVCTKMVAVAKRLGLSITWTGQNIKLNRASLANYISVFAHYNKALMPKG